MDLVVWVGAAASAVTVVAGGAPQRRRSRLRLRRMSLATLDEHAGRWSQIADIGRIGYPPTEPRLTPYQKRDSHLNVGGPHLPAAPPGSGTTLNIPS